jgi:hypothetical protein
MQAVGALERRRLVPFPVRGGGGGGLRGVIGVRAPLEQAAERGARGGRQATEARGEAHLTA